MNPDPKKENSGLNILQDNENKSIQFGSFEKLMEKYGMAAKNLKDREEVDFLIDKMFEIGCRPVVTVNVDRAEQAKSKGLMPYRTWEKGFRMDMKSQQIYETEKEEKLRGTFGIPAYLPSGKERIALVLDIPRKRIAPVYTGPNHTFNGVVQISGERVDASVLRQIDIEKVGDSELKHTRKRIDSTLGEEAAA